MHELASGSTEHPEVLKDHLPSAFILQSSACISPCIQPLQCCHLLAVESFASLLHKSHVGVLQKSRFSVAAFADLCAALNDRHQEVGVLIA